LYINDFINTTNILTVRHFADDTSSGECLNNLLYQINSELPKIYDWLCANKLSLNFKKTTYIIFQPRQKVDYNLYLPLSIGNKYLQQSPFVKYLGIFIDSHLTWRNHLDHIASKISKNINIISKLSSYLDQHVLKTLYYSLIYPYLTYGCILWVSNYISSLEDIIKLQNKAIRIICDIPLQEHITPFYSTVGMLKLPGI